MNTIKAERIIITFNKIEKMNNNEIKYKVMDKLMSVEDNALLIKIDALIGDINVDEKDLIVSKAQLKMLRSSEADLKNDQIITEEDLNQEEDKWLSE